MSSLNDIIRALRRAGIEPTARELAESLWLATQIASAGAGPGDAEPGPSRPAPATRSGPPPPPPVRPPGPEPAEPSPDDLELEAALPSGDGVDTLGITPRPVALGDRLRLQRALRPLLRRVPAPGLGVLDEEKTAGLIAELPPGLGWPVVMRPAEELWLDAVVVIDQGDSMLMWEGLAADLVDVLRESGAFRQVARYRMDGTSGEVGEWGGRALTPWRLVDQGNRRLTLVVSDCVGPAWRSGAAGTALSTWGRYGPVAILQPLPERLWPRTAAPATAGTLSAPRPGAPNRSLTFTAFGGRDRPEGTLVPVFQIDADWLRRWTGLVAGGPPIIAAVTGVTSYPMEPPRATRGPRPTPQQRVRRFRAAASEEAFRLARYTAMSEPNLDTMRMVQQALFRPALPIHLAEVLLSGLLRVEDGRRGRYRFVDGVPEVLLSALSVSETIHASRVLDEIAGFARLRTVDDGPEILVAPPARHRVTMAHAQLRRWTEPAGPPPPAREGLLDPENAVVRFAFREPELAALLDWAEGSGPATTTIAGPAGTGKTRLARELAARLRERGWLVAEAGAPVPAGTRDLLVLVDQADLDPGRLSAAENIERPGRVRVLALARTPVDRPVVLRLGALAGPDRQIHYWQAVEDLGRALAGEGRPPGGHTDEYGDTPLAIALAALRAVAGPGAHPALEALAERELSLAGPGRPALHVAAAQLFGAATAAEAERLVGPADWLHRLYPGDGDEYWGLLPDPLREQLVRSAGPALLDLLPRATADQAGRALRLLVRLGGDLAAATWTVAVRDPGLVAALLSVARLEDFVEPARDTIADLGTPEPVLTAVVEGLRPLTGAPGGDAAFARVLIAHARRLDREGRWADGLAAVTEAIGLLQWLGPEQAEQEAYARTQQAGLLSRLGRLTEAGDAAREATNRYRQFAVADPRHRAGLADALLLETATARARDQRDLALKAGAEAVELYERLDAEDPGRHRVRLAYACCAHGMDLGEYRSDSAALDWLDRAARLYRDADIVGLATAQAGRGEFLTRLGRPAEAAEAYAEVVAVHRRLGRRDRSLAGALTAQAEATAAAGRLDEAAGLLTEANGLRFLLYTDDSMDVGLRKELIAGYRLLADVHRRRGDRSAQVEALASATLLGGES
ncbi:SAV_2336 N-terminal domain-related protein [Actinoplanes sp. CA-054009]